MLYLKGFVVVVGSGFRVVVWLLRVVVQPMSASRGMVFSIFFTGFLVLW